MTTKTRFSAWVLAVAVLAALTGCARGKVRFGAEAPAKDLSKYRSVAVTVVNDVGDKCPPDISKNLQAAAIKWLQAYTRSQTLYPDAFKEVRPSPMGEEDELLVEVHITKCRKGSRVARAMLVGLGASKISITLDLLDSPSKKLLKSAQLDLVWAAGGALGASKGIEDLANNAGRKVADAVLACKEGRK